MNKYFLDDRLFRLIGNGFFAVNKIKNVTSAKVLERLKEVIVNGLETPEDERVHPLRMGHGGTLDITATGVLVVGICNGCKVLPTMLHGTKCYSVTARLGIATDTYNDTGAVVKETPYEHVSWKQLEKALCQFKGHIMQTPPAYSAIKRGGVRMSDLIRTGQPVELSPRKVTCYSIRCLDFRPPYFSLEVNCGKGFYIRSLIHDLGIAVGSSAHVTELTRLSNGPFKLSECMQLEDCSLEDIINHINRARCRHRKLTEQINNYLRNHRKEQFERDKENCIYY